MGKGWTFAATTVAVMVLAGGVFAQNRPDFSGTWTLDRDPGTPVGGTRPREGAQAAGRTAGGRAPNAPARMCGLDCTIVQHTRTLTITRPADPQGVTPADVVLNLDGSDSSNVQAGRDGGPPTAYVLKATWDGRALAVTRTFGSAGQVTETQTMSLEGATLVIVTTVNLDGAVPQTSRYRKVQ